MLEAARGMYQISTNTSRLDISVIHRFLSEAYWSPGIDRETVERSIEHSLPFGIYLDTEQVGFARVISDRATFAYIADVFIVPTHRGQGLGKWLVDVILGHPELQGLRLWMLRTRDAHGLYEQFGFQPPSIPSLIMERSGSGSAAPQIAQT